MIIYLIVISHNSQVFYLTVPARFEPLQSVSLNRLIRRLQQVGLPRFTPTRLCGSQALSIQSLFYTSRVGKKYRHQPALTSKMLAGRGLHPVSCFVLSGLSCPPKADQSSGSLKSNHILAKRRLRNKRNGERNFCFHFF